MSPLPHRSGRMFLAIVAVVALADSAYAQGTPWKRDAGSIPAVLDSLAAISVGPYVHLEVGSCVPGRCEERVSIYRTDVGDPYLYRSFAWIPNGDGKPPSFRGYRQEMSEEEAGVILGNARVAGILGLRADSTGHDISRPRFWLRARFGEHVIALDGVSLSALTYVSNEAGGLGGIFSAVEQALFAPLVARAADR